MRFCKIEFYSTKNHTVKFREDPSIIYPKPHINPTTGKQFSTPKTVKNNANVTKFGTSQFFRTRNDAVKFRDDRSIIYPRPLINPTSGKQFSTPKTVKNNAIITKCGTSKFYRTR